MGRIIFRKAGYWRRDGTVESAEWFASESGSRGYRQAPAKTIVVFCFALVCVATNDAMAQAGKRVLVVHSFGSAAPPFTTHSIAVETELTERIGERLDLDEVSLDHARYADPDMQEALVAYLEKRHAKWQPDLVVPIG